ncbi:MAG: hypothetical protein D6681_14045 [Calditrichaeota bacterium]|nr:MAG: hypothetical protein D6681_14045 [Calditrichota bacterium]
MEIFHIGYKFSVHPIEQPRIRWMVIVGLLVELLLFSGCGQKSAPPLPAEKKRELANVLYNQQLYAQAIEEYKDYLRRYPLEIAEQANISYQIANIYFERLHDYENALAYYLRAKYLNPESPAQKQLSKRIVECLERLNRSTDARQVIKQSAALDTSQAPPSRPGEVLAKIGDREITSGDLEYYISRLPQMVREQIDTPEQKQAILRQYIAQELLYNSALRQGLDQDKDVLEGMFEAKKALMVEKLLQQEIEQEISLDKYDNSDVQTYYEAHKERYAERDDQGNIRRIPPFAEVAQRVAQDFIQEKQQAAYQRIIERLMKAEHVVIYDDRIR